MGLETVLCTDQVLLGGAGLVVQGLYWTAEQEELSQQLDVLHRGGKFETSTKVRCEQLWRAGVARSFHWPAITPPRPGSKMTCIQISNTGRCSSHRAYLLDLQLQLGFLGGVQGEGGAGLGADRKSVV